MQTGAGPLDRGGGATRERPAGIRGHVHVLSGAVTAPVFPGVYELEQPQVGNTTASIAAFSTAVGLHTDRCNSVPP
jgi:hypothetical protein